MKRSVLALVTAASVIFGLAACADDGSYESADYSRVCVNEVTHERVDGAQCGSDDSSAASGFLWWYLIWGRTLPSYGAPVTGGYSHVRKSAVIEHDETLAPTGGKSYTKTKTRAYSTGSGKKLGTTKGGSGYKAPAPKQPAKVNGPQKAPNVKPPAGGGYKAPAVKAPAPAAPRPVAPAPRPPAPIRIK